MHNKQIQRILDTVWQRDKEHFFHSYTNFEEFKKTGSVIYERGKGHFIYDDQGKEYLDGIAGLWCVNIGHGNEEIASYMKEQAGKLAYYNTFEDASSAPAANLAHKLAELCPENLNKVFYASSGSVANDTAIKIAHYYFNKLGKPKKKLVISRDLAYHGSTFLSHTLTGITSTHVGFDLVKGLVHYVSAPYSYRNSEGKDEAAFLQLLFSEFEKKILALGPEKVACFIAEPIMGAGGVIVPPKGYHKGMKAICEKYDMLYISDEVVTAFGRLGHMVASEQVFEIQPDMIVFAKGISSGYIPLAATMISDQIYEVISQKNDKNPSFSHGFTYAGHTLACGVGLKNIEIIEKLNLCDHVAQWGPYFESKLKTLMQQELVGDVRGSHFMLSIELVKNKKTKESFPDELTIARKVYLHCKKEGLIVRPIGPLIVLSPPLSYDKLAIDRTIEILKSALENVAKEVLNKK